MTENRFDKAAAKWDKPERIALAASIHDAIKKELHFTGEERLMDFGCGTGLLSLPFAPDVKHLAGIDTSTGMLKTLMEKAEDLGLENVSSHECHLVDDDCHIDPGNIFISSMAFHHVADVAELCKKIYQLLLPGGTMAVADLEPEDGFFHREGAEFIHKGIDPHELTSFCQEAGFSAIKWERILTLMRERNGEEKPYHIFLLTAHKPG
jgi:tRNA (cmo5U34)-methyltransferase